MLGFPFRTRREEHKGYVYTGAKEHHCNAVTEKKAGVLNRYKSRQMRQTVLKNQQGMAMFVAIMMLSLGTSFALLAWQVSSSELEISRYSESEAAVHTLAESGIEKVISWINNPAGSPDETFFENLSLPTNCINNKDNADLSIDYDYLTDSDVGPFKALKGMGEIVEIYFYKPTHPKGICTVGVWAINTKGGEKTIEVELTQNPLGAITAGIQGKGNTDEPSPVWLHWGKIQYTGSANLGLEILKIPEKELEFVPEDDGSPYNPDNYDSNQDYLMGLDVGGVLDPPLPDDDNDRPNLKEGQDFELDPIDLKAIKRFIRQQGEVYIVSEEAGMIEDHQGDAKSFDELFGPEGESEVPKRRLVLIEMDDSSSHEPLLIEGGPYRGYFYFSESMSADIDIRIINLVDSAMTVLDVVPPPREDDFQPDVVDLSNLNLEGFFYVGGKAEVQDSFKVFGGLYAKEGFIGAEATNLELWYNSAFATSDYAGVRRLTPLAGTWNEAVGSE